MKSENIPTKTLRELAKEKGLPQGGKATALRERIADSIPSSEVAAYAQDYQHTRRAFSYILYRVRRHQSNIHHEERRPRPWQFRGCEFLYTETHHRTGGKDNHARFNPRHLRCDGFH